MKLINCGLNMTKSLFIYQGNTLIFESSHDRYNSISSVGDRVTELSKLEPRIASTHSDFIFLTKSRLTIFNAKMNFRITTVTQTKTRIMSKI